MSAAVICSFFGLVILRGVSVQTDRLLLPVCLPALIRKQQLLSKLPHTHTHTHTHTEVSGSPTSGPSAGSGPADVGGRTLGRDDDLNLPNS